MTYQFPCTEVAPPGPSLPCRPRPPLARPPAGQGKAGSKAWARARQRGNYNNISPTLRRRPRQKALPRGTSKTRRSSL